MPSPPPPPPSLPGVKIHRRRLADGTIKEYAYPRRRAPRSAYDIGSLGAAIIAWKASPEWGDLAASTRANYTIYLQPLERVAHLALKDLRRAHLFALRDAIAAARGRGAATGFVRTAQALLSWCRARGLLEHSPADRLPTLKGGHLPAWTAEQAEAALTRLPAHLARVVLLAMHTGQRRGDLCRLAWSAWDGCTLRLTQQKTGRALVIPAHPTLRAALDTWRQAATATTILTDARARPWQPGYLSEALPRAMRRAGLPPLGVHGLRKLAAALLAEAGCTVNEVAAITGHTTLAMVQLYTASADQKRLARAAVTRLSSVSRNDVGNGKRSSPTR
ncbi:MAG: tyrosine-type recombinase/integrase [Burkholderiaceae bacterium]|nr:tyrosine-type recombinase/integrase [Burkholderiaceae bacterium]